MPLKRLYSKEAKINSISILKAPAPIKKKDGCCIRCVVNNTQVTVNDIRECGEKSLVDG